MVLQAVGITLNDPLQGLAALSTLDTEARVEHLE